MSECKVSDLSGRKSLECLDQLHREIRDVLVEYRETRINITSLLKSFVIEERFKFAHNILPIFLCSFLLFISVSSENYLFNFLNGVIIFVLSVLNLVMIFFFYVKRSLIIYEKAQLVLALISNLDSAEDTNINYNIFEVDMPSSQSITSQETIRDGKVVNLPLNLLVKGDLIKIRPGQIVNVECETIENCNRLEKGSIYEPFENSGKKRSAQTDEMLFNGKENDHASFLDSYIESCELIQLPQSIYCTVQRTPYLKYLKSVLYNHQSDSDSIIKNEISQVTQLLLIYVIPSLLTIQLLISTINYLILAADQDIFMTSLSYLLLPLFPVSFTLFWKISTLHATVTLLKSLKCLKKLFLTTSINNSSKNDDQKVSNRKLSSKKPKYFFKYQKRTSIDTSYSREGHHTFSASFKQNRTINIDASDEPFVETPRLNLSQDDLSQINELSSIESLIAAIPVEVCQPTDNMNNHRCNPIGTHFSKIYRKIKFYLKTVDLILFNKPSLRNDGQVNNDLDVQNASFIFYSNFLFGLGIITNFACVDKKGVLSWPNPTADKILTFSKKIGSTKLDDLEPEHVGNERDTYNVTGETSLINHQQEESNNKLTKFTDKNRLECYNLTHDSTNGYKLKFDDIDWKNNLNSLKPLGLSILLNTCNTKLTNCYNKLCDFVRLESSQIVHTNQIENHHSRFQFANDTSGSASSFTSHQEEHFELKAIIDRRCLCEISNIIGFNKHETAAAHEQNIIATNSICRNLEIKSVSKVRPKQIRVSSLISLVSQDLDPNSCLSSLFCQGSPDLIFDFCSDYWNGERVCDLGKPQRKKLLDLYQRYSAASYCTAFSYKPLIDENLDLIDNSGFVLKCPPSYCEKMSSLSDFANLIDADDQSENLSLSEESVRTVNEKASGGFLNRTEYGHECEVGDNRKRIEGVLGMHSGQVFLGMISMQYCAKPDVMRLIEKLEKSCIRFIHFSSDNEQISRTFAEMLGLDTGWNCHISLDNNNTSITSKKLTNEQISTFSRTDHNQHDSTARSVNQPSDRTFFNKLSIFEIICSRENFRKRRTKKRDVYKRFTDHNASLPELKIIAKVGSTEPFFGQYQIGKFEAKKAKACKLRRKMKLKRLNSSCSYYESSESSLESSGSAAKLISKSMAREEESVNAVNMQEEELSSGRKTVYSGRTLSETDIHGNAAKLPKGVENIRTHLEKEIDNVPLHVSLFTDSTKPAIYQTIEIMKDYGEIVACFGSTHSIENNEIFSISNIGIGVEPLYPKLCVNSCLSDSETGDTKALTELTVCMNTLSCGLNLKHENISILPPLLSLAREIIHSYRIALIFMLMSNLSVSVVQLLCNILFLPPILSGFQIIFLILFTIPILSYSLINKYESSDHRCSNKKNKNLINTEDIKSFMFKFLIKFFPSICILVVFHFFSLYFICKHIEKPIMATKSNTTIIYSNLTNSTPTKQCSLFAIDLVFSVGDKDSLQKYESSHESLMFTQIFVHVLISIYFVFISINYVNIEKSLWAYLPFKNRTWTKTVITVLLFHLVYLFVRLYTIGFGQAVRFWQFVPAEYWIVTALWPLFLVFFNEFFKFFEIKETIRQYKKLKLEFDTKLGMNSPFV